MKNLKLLMAIIGLLIALVFGSSFLNPSAIDTEADLVLINGNIITVDADDSIAEAVAVKDGLILKVGTNEDMDAHLGLETEVIDLEGKTVTPGLIDSHNHLVYFGQTEKDYLNLRPPDVTNIADIVARVEEKISQLSPGEWVIGDGFFQLTDGRLPNKLDLDPVSPNNPVFVTHIGGHFGTANSVALDSAGIDADTPDPVGGIIGKDPDTGEPSGIMWNHPAMDLIRKHYPPFTLDDLVEDIKFAQDIYIPHGVTSFQDVNSRGLIRLEAYKAAEDSLKIRGYILFTVEKTIEATISLQYTELFSRPWLSYLGNKFLLDGQPPTSYTYDPHPGPSYELPTWNPDTLKAVVKDLHNAGHQLAFHVMGDKAIDLAMDAIEEALNETPNPDHRHRLEHCMIPTLDGIQRMKDLGMVVSLQPGAIFHSGDAYIGVWGPDRVQRLKAMRTMLDLGIPVALGSDFPTVPQLEPQLALWAAVKRETKTGVVIAPQESVTIQEALRAHTMGSAYAAFEEDVKGSIEEGKYADMAVWSGDLYSVPIDEVKDLEIEMVIIDGKVYKDFEVAVYEHFLEAHHPAILNSLYPSPFKSAVNIEYEISKNRGNPSLPVKLEIFDMSGKRIKVLVDQKERPGQYTVQWDGKNEAGANVPAGMYMIQIFSGDIFDMGFVVLQK